MCGKSLGSSHPTLFNAAEARERNIIGKKLQEERKNLKLSLDEVSAKLENCGIHISKSAISKWEGGSTIPSAYQMLAICAALGVDDSVSYFSGQQKLNEIGRRRVADYTEDLIASKRYEPEPSVIKKIVYINMPISYMAASAGTGNFLDDDNFEMLQFPKSIVPKNADFAIKISGDSMEPVYSDGQTVWVKKCKELKPGEVGIFTLDGSAYIKVYNECKPSNAEEYTDSSGVIHTQPVLVSYNEKYSPIVVSPGQRLEIVGKVL